MLVNIILLLFISSIVVAKNVKNIKRKIFNKNIDAVFNKFFFIFYKNNLYSIIFMIK